MKKILSHLLIPLTILLTLALPLHAALDNDPEGFGGIKWGSPSKVVQGLQEKGEAGSYIIYTRKGDNLKYGNIRFGQCMYAFDKKLGLTFVALTTSKGEDNQRNLQKALQTQFGKPQSILHFDQAWKNGETIITTEYLPEEGVYALIYISDEVMIKLGKNMAAGFLLDIPYDHMFSSIFSGLMGGSGRSSQTQRSSRNTREDDYNFGNSYGFMGLEWGIKLSQTRGMIPIVEHPERDSTTYGHPSDDLSPLDLDDFIVGYNIHERHGLMAGTLMTNKNSKTNYNRLARILRQQLGSPTEQDSDFMLWDDSSYMASLVHNDGIVTYVFIDSETFAKTRGGRTDKSTPQRPRNYR